MWKVYGCAGVYDYQTGVSGMQCACTFIGWTRFHGLVQDMPCVWDAGGSVSALIIGPFPFFSLFRISVSCYGWKAWASTCGWEVRHWLHTESTVAHNCTPWAPKNLDSPRDQQRQCRGDASGVIMHENIVCLYVTGIQTHTNWHKWSAKALCM